MANYTEDKRTLALLRIRGVAPAQMRRFMLGMLLAPAALGFIVGGVTAIVAGFGLANYVWDLREIRSVVQLLPTHLRASWTTAAVDSRPHRAARERGDGIQLVGVSAHRAPARQGGVSRVELVLQHQEAWMWP